MGLTKKINYDSRVYQNWSFAKFGAALQVLKISFSLVHSAKYHHMIISVKKPLSVIIVGGLSPTMRAGVDVAYRSELYKRANWKTQTNCHQPLDTGTSQFPKMC